MIFWHESSATKPGGTTRDGRAREPGAANIPAMPVAGGAPLVSVPQAGGGRRGGSCDYGADRSTLSGPALLWLAPDGGMAGDPRPSRQPQAGAAPDAAAGTGGDLPAPEYEQAGSGTQDLSLPAARARDRAGQSSVVLRRYLHPDGQGLCLPGGDHGLGKPRGAGVASIEHTRRRFLRRGARGSALALWPARDLQYRPEPALAKAGGSQFTSDDFTGTLKRHGITISMDGKGRCMDNIFVERLWRSLKYEEVYLNAYATVAEAKTGIGAWLSFYNDERQHQSLGYRTPRQIYEEGLWICGRSASPTGSASPASRVSSESREMLAFAHIPTGATANKGIDVNDSKNSTV